MESVESVKEAHVKYWTSGRYTLPENVASLVAVCPERQHASHSPQYSPYARARIARRGRYCSMPFASVLDTVASSFWHIFNTFSFGTAKEYAAVTKTYE